MLLELGTRLLETRKPKTEMEPAARELLGGFVDVCMRTGLDVLVNDDLVEQTVPALVAQLKAADIDGGGPRNAKPRQVADAILAALGLTLGEIEGRPILTLDASVRTGVVAALSSVVDGELVPAAMREKIIAQARRMCPEQYFTAFQKMAAELDERGVRLTKQLKLPIDAVQAVQQALAAARDGFFDRVGRAAIDRAKDVIAKANPEAAARIDEPVTLKLTPRDVAIRCAQDARLPKNAPAVVDALLGGLTQCAQLAWSAPAIVARPYSAVQTFAVGETITHPKFGQGTVAAVVRNKIDVEFETGKVTLVHAPPK
ncbi:MAG TPA: hypothetical protein VL326_17725 [Kofleriaceae bacterium]|nr:hypothetical protein [Kofleriaceae bacterium]